jgi:hypothetical protein
MTSTRQIEANRANAKKSSGPKTTNGKARSRINALRHGLTAEMLIIAGENASELEKLREALLERYRPQCVLEAELVERLLGLLWRLRRAPSFEAAILKAREKQCSEFGRLPSSYPEERDEEASSEQRSGAIGEALIHDASFGDALGKLARHETTLMNAFSKTLQTLSELQASDRETDVASLRAA